MGGTHEPASHGAARMVSKDEIGCCPRDARWFEKGKGAIARAKIDFDQLQWRVARFHDATRNHVDVDLEIEGEGVSIHCLDHLDSLLVTHLLRE